MNEQAKQYHHISCSTNRSDILDPQINHVTGWKLYHTTHIKISMKLMLCNNRITTFKISINKKLVMDAHWFKAPLKLKLLQINLRTRHSPPHGMGPHDCHTVTNEKTSTSATACICLKISVTNTKSLIPMKAYLHLDSQIVANR